MAYTIGVVCSLGVGPSRGGRSRNEDNYLVCQDGKVQYLDCPVTFSATPGA